MVKSNFTFTNKLFIGQVNCACELKEKLVVFKYLFDSLCLIKLTLNEDTNKYEDNCLEEKEIEDILEKMKKIKCSCG